MAAMAWLPRIDTERCTGCGWCVAACPPHVLSLQASGWRKRSVLHEEQGCTGCRKCERQCPFGAIEMALCEAAEASEPARAGAIKGRQA